VYVLTLRAPLLDHVRADADPRLAHVVAMLRAWNEQRVDANGDGTYDDPSVTVFNAWYTALVNEVFVPKLGAAYAVGGADENVTANLVYRLLRPTAPGLPRHLDYLGAASAADAVTHALVTALDRLTAQYGSPDVSTWLTPAATIHWRPLGAASVPDTPWMNRGTYNQILALGPGRIRGENVVAPGQSGDVRSPHVADQLALYGTWQYKPMRLAPVDVLEHAINHAVSSSPLMRPERERRQSRTASRGSPPDMRHIPG
jgi:penicillin amidase